MKLVGRGRWMYVCVRVCEELVHLRRVAEEEGAVRRTGT